MGFDILGVGEEEAEGFGVEGGLELRVGCVGGEGCEERGASGMFDGLNVFEGHAGVLAPECLTGLGGEGETANGGVADESAVFAPDLEGGGGGVVGQGADEARRSAATHAEACAADGVGVHLVGKIEMAGERGFVALDSVEEVGKADVE